MGLRFAVELPPGESAAAWAAAWAHARLATSDLAGVRITADSGGWTVSVPGSDGLRRALCLPVSAEGLLARAAALPPGEEATGALQLALARAAEPAIREEALFQLGIVKVASDVTAAIADLDAARLLHAGARHEDCLRALSRLYVRDGRCTEAAPLLAELATLGPLGPDAPLAEACGVEKSPAP